MILRSAPSLSIQMERLLHPLLKEAILSKFIVPMLAKLCKNWKEVIAKLKSTTSFSIHTSTSLLARLLSSPFTFSRSRRLLRSVFRQGSSVSPTVTCRRRLKPKTQNQGKLKTILNDIDTTNCFPIVVSNSWRCLISIGRVTCVLQRSKWMRNSRRLDSTLKTTDWQLWRTTAPFTLSTYQRSSRDTSRRLSADSTEHRTLSIAIAEQLTSDLEKKIRESSCHFHTHRYFANLMVE